MPGMNKGITDFPTRLASVAAETEMLLKQLLGDAPLDREILRPARLDRRHAPRGSGWRQASATISLLVETAAVFGAARSGALTAGAALELVHCYSLVHDDLPAMDDDDLRRGRPTVHKAFDEATAILVGDALLTLAFDVMARPEVHADPAVRIALVAELARASGLGGMAGGQMLDLAAEGRFGAEAYLRRKRDRNAAGDEDGRVDPFRLSVPGQFSDKPTPPHAPTSIAMASRSARLSRSPTICLTSRATRKRSAKLPARMPRPARRHSLQRLGLRRRACAPQRTGDRGRQRAGSLRREGRYFAGCRPFRRRAGEREGRTRMPSVKRTPSCASSRE